MIRGEISGQSGPPSAAGVRSGGAPWTVRQLSSRPSGGSPTARRAAAPGSPSDRPHAVPAVSARCRTRARGPGRQPYARYAIAGKATVTKAERRALSGPPPPPARAPEDPF
jgi:hypothetical protein